MKIRWLAPSVIAGITLLLAACLPDCDVDRRNSVLSPNGKMVAVVFGVDCGATTGFNTQLSVLPSDAAFDRDEYPPVLVLKDKQELGIRWASDTSLSVTVPDGAHENKRLDVSGGVAITYEKTGGL
ncbi:hypothetical protein [Taklimakanibacter lacteus]|uniref:hypothetical protein n=1 Tax=Taklimakanibacter lacteus TaxID=2268456 RepID=UPI000E665B3F